jgi:hypothetical protein
MTLEYVAVRKSRCGVSLELLSKAGVEGPNFNIDPLLCSFTSLIHLYFHILNLLLLLPFPGLTVLADLGPRCFAFS